MYTIKILGKSYNVAQSGNDDEGLPVYLVQREKLSYFTVRHHRDKDKMFLASSRSMNTYDVLLTDTSGQLEYVTGKWS